MYNIEYLYLWVAMSTALLQIDLGVRLILSVRTTEFQNCHVVPIKTGLKSDHKMKEVKTGLKSEHKMKEVKTGLEPDHKMK